MTSLVDHLNIRAQVTQWLDAIDVVEPFELAEATNERVAAGLRPLLEHPERWARLVADPARIAAVVEEPEARIAVEELTRRAPTLRLAARQPHGGLWVELA